MYKELYIKLHMIFFFIDQADPYEVQPWMINPFDSPKIIYTG